MPVFAPFRFVFIVLFAASLSACLTPEMMNDQAAAEDPNKEIIQVAGDLYRFRNNNHYSVFLVTPDGIILGDPINSEAATWLKGVQPPC